MDGQMDVYKTHVRLEKQRETKLDFKEILKVYYNNLSIQFLYRTFTNYKYTFDTESHPHFLTVKVKTMFS